MRDAQRAAIVVRAGRTARGLSRKELAAASTAADSTIANFENGQRRLTAEMSTRFAQALGITDDQFIDGLAAATHSLRLWEAGETEWCFPVRSWVEAAFEPGADRVRLVEASITELLKPESLVVAPDTPASKRLGEMLESFREAAGMTIEQIVSPGSMFGVTDFEAAESGDFGTDPTALAAEFLTAVGVPMTMSYPSAIADSGVDMRFLDPERNVRVELDFKTRHQRESRRSSVALAMPPPALTPDPRTREELIGMIVARLVQAPMEVIAQVAEQVGIEVGPWLRE